MELFHAVVLNEANKITHKVISSDELKSVYYILNGPFSLPMYNISLVALTTKNNISTNFWQEIKCKLSLSIIDDLEKKLLLKEYHQRRTIFLLGELLQMLKAGFSAIDCQLRSIEPDSTNGVIYIYFSLLRQSTTNVLGSLMCLLTMVDYLLFSRSLCLGDVSLSTEPQIDINLLDIVAKLI
jgi:hypothetical protein